MHECPRSEARYTSTIFLLSTNYMKPTPCIRVRDTTHESDFIFCSKSEKIVLVWEIVPIYDVISINLTRTLISILTRCLYLFPDFNLKQSCLGQKLQQKFNFPKNKIEELILLVSENEVVYNPASTSYRDKIFTDNCW